MLCEGRVGIAAKVSEGRACSGKTRKAVADEPVPFFSGNSLKISTVKQFKTGFNYLSSTSIMQFSQGAVIQPVLLSCSLLPMSPQSFSFILPSVSSLLSLLFPQEWKFPEGLQLCKTSESYIPGSSRQHCIPSSPALENFKLY